LSKKTQSDGKKKKPESREEKVATVEPVVLKEFIRGWQLHFIVFERETGSKGRVVEDF
jgi:hypothetical protein